MDGLITKQRFTQFFIIANPPASIQDKWCTLRDNLPHKTIKCMSYKNINL